jgi:chromosomal replication initiation ATPase DnaA
MTPCFAKNRPNVAGVAQVMPNGSRQLVVTTVQAVVRDYYGLSPGDLTGPARARRNSWPRQVAMAILRQRTNMSLPEIGLQFGGRDHTTVMHACENVAKRCAANQDLKIDFDRIVTSLTGVTHAEFIRQKTVHGLFISVRTGAAK